MKERIKEIRKFLKLSQTEFAKKLGKTLRMVQYYEAGERNIDDGVVFRLQHVFNINPNWFKTGIGDMFLTPATPNFNKLFHGVPEWTEEDGEIEDEIIFTSDVINLLANYSKLSDADKEKVLSFIYSLVKH